MLCIARNMKTPNRIRPACSRRSNIIFLFFFLYFCVIFFSLGWGDLFLEREGGEKLFGIIRTVAVVD